MSDFASALEFTRMASAPIRDRAMHERAAKAAKVTDTRGAEVEGIVVARTATVVKRTTMYKTTVFFPRPKTVDASVTFFEIETYVPESQKPDAKWIIVAPAQEGAKFRIFYDTSYQIKEGMSAPVNHTLNRGDVVTVVGLRYERVHNTAPPPPTGDKGDLFSITAVEVRANKTRGAWELADATVDLMSLLRLNAELSRESFEAFCEDYQRVMGVPETYHRTGWERDPNDPYLACRRYFVLPVDQSFVEHELEKLQAYETVTATFFDSTLDGRDSYVSDGGGATATTEPEEQRILRVAIKAGALVRTGAVTFVAKQNKFVGEERSLQMSLVKVRMPVYAESLLVVPTVADWEHAGPTLARGAAGALVVTPKMTIEMDEPQPHVEVHGSLVWDLRRTVANVGIEVSAESAKQYLRFPKKEWELLGTPLDVKTRTPKPDEHIVPLRHVRPHMDCVNLRFVKGSIRRLARAVEEGQASFVVVGHDLKTDSLKRIEEIRAMDEPERREAYHKLLRLPDGDHAKEDVYQVFAVAPNVMQYIDGGEAV